MMLMNVHLNEGEARVQTEASEGFERERSGSLPISQVRARQRPRDQSNLPGN